MKEWGPRKTGKSSLLRDQFPESAWFDFHDTDLFFETSKRPAILRERILGLDEKSRSQPIVLDEVQKVPLVLEDTLIGYTLEPFAKTRRRDILLKAPKFYFFDTGIAASLNKQIISDQKGAEFGHASEHFLFMELIAYRTQTGLDFPIRYWRTSTGLEVDFILGEGEVAIEVKSASRIDGKDLTELKAFQETSTVKRSLVVCNEKSARKTGNIEILPWRVFLEKLAAGKVIA